MTKEASNGAGTLRPSTETVKTEKSPSKRKVSQARSAAPVSAPKSDSSPELALETFLKKWLSGAGTPTVIINGSLTVGAILLGNGDVGGVGNVDGAKQNAAGCQTGDRVENNDSFGKEAA